MSLAQYDPAAVIAVLKAADAWVKRYAAETSSRGGECVALTRAVRLLHAPAGSSMPMIISVVAAECNPQTNPVEFWERLQQMMKDYGVQP